MIWEQYWTQIDQLTLINAHCSTTYLQMINRNWLVFHFFSVLLHEKSQHFVCWILRVSLKSLLWVYCLPWYAKTECWNMMFQGCRWPLKMQYNQRTVWKWFNCCADNSSVLPKYLLQYLTMWKQKMYHLFLNWGSNQSFKTPNTGSKYWQLGHERIQ